MVIEDAYYRVFRTIDNLEIIPYGTGSTNNDFTRLSYDVSGNYFELDTSCLEPGYSYGIQFAYYLQGDYTTNNLKCSNLKYKKKMYEQSEKFIPKETKKEKVLVNT
jgi:hypothetical protein